MAVTTYTFVDNTEGVASEVNANFTQAFNGASPIGSMVPWLKTFNQLHTGTNSSTSTNKLVSSGENFSLSNCPVGSIVRNSTDATWAYVTAVDSTTQLSLSANIFTATSKTYYVYSTPYLPVNWLEANGQTVSDSESPYNGVALPDLISPNSFFRCSSTSGATGGSNSHTHSVPYGGWSSSAGWSSGVLSAGINSGGNEVMTGNNTTGSTSTLPTYYEIVPIIRIK